MKLYHASALIHHIVKLGHLALQLALSGITEKLDVPLGTPVVELRICFCVVFVWIYIGSV